MSVTGVLQVWVAALLVHLAASKVVLRPEGFLKLPTYVGTTTFNAGVANKAAYDSVTNLLYVVGHDNDVMQIINMKDSLTNPVHARSIRFDPLNQGFPNDVKVCRGGLPTLEFLAISFETKNNLEQAHVHLYQLLEQPGDALVRLKTVATVEGYDPNSIAWHKDCTELVVVSQGTMHVLNGELVDPKPSVDVLIPRLGLNVDRRTVPFSETAITSARVRQVMTKCDTGSYTQLISHVEDLEPNFVVVDDDNIAYVLMQSNNAIGRMDLQDPLTPMSYHNMGRKDWSQYKMDTSYEDGGINQNPHSMTSLYQPAHAVAFKFANKTWLATADTANIRRHNIRSGSTTLCNFDESVVGATWTRSNTFSSFMDANTAAQLKTNMSSNAITGRLPFCQLKTFQDGYNPLQLSYSYLTTYGGRGWSLIDASDMSRVYDSGDIMETYFASSAATDSDKAVYNSYYQAPQSAQSQYVDRTSINTGPNPTAIATGNINGTQVVVVANGNIGGLYTFSITLDGSGAPQVGFEGFIRRGSPGLTWANAYVRSDDAVGEPGIEDLLWIEDEGQHVVVAISKIAGVASFYEVQLQ
ncbi:hypothetical protein EGW08_003698 [Elysia chlorotica]|uniref:Choice-of-anchor I domain-containing protein n=1 Tax=Elysia chlorotica TaxID=188477 RepID=A0A3S1BTV0_ELYCH|nr:hypothetical protein EGW08_003698 [Elysia chlorotica]